tara:strand:+ start:202 stop:438 length:237 start_codon:yes stop_codon:yes gene_type:complete
MKYILIVLIFIGFNSCKEEHPLADQLCDCYSQLHRAYSDSAVVFWGDSCKALHINIILQLEEDAAEKKIFNKAYRRCQ